MNQKEIHRLLLVTSICLVGVGIFGTASGMENVRFVQMFKAGLENPVDVAVSLGETVYVLDEDQSKVFMFDHNGKLEKIFAEKGNGPVQLNRPQSLALSPHGRLVIADTGNNRMQVFNTEGRFLFQFSSAGSEVGQLRIPSGVAVDQFGFIYVADKDNRRVQIFSPNGIFLKAFPTEFRPTDISLDPQRNIYVLLPENDSIVKYSPDGQMIETFSCVVDGRNYVSQANGIAVDHRGDIYLTEREKHSIKKINQYEDVLISFGSQGQGRGQFHDAKGVFADQGEKIYIADSQNQRVQVLRITGSEKESMEPEKKSPLILDFQSIIKAQEGVVDLATVEGRGFYILSESGNEIIIKADEDKTIGRKGVDKGEFKRPKAMTVTLDGKIFVADTGNHRVQIFNPDGQFEYQFGKRGNKDGQFNSPQGIAVNSEGRIFVADTQNDRVQAFNHDGIFLYAFGFLPIGGKPTPMDLRQPTALAVNSLDEIYVLDSGNNRIQVFTSDGMLVKTIGSKGNLPGQFKNPTDIALDESDNLYVADRGNYRIQIFNPQGNLIQSFGSPGEGGGYFRELSAVAVSEGKIFVADYLIDHVQVFRYVPDGLTTSERMYATKTAYPPEDFDGNDTARFHLAKKAATQKAIKELVANSEYSLEHLEPFIRASSVELLNDGQIKVTVCAPREIPKEIEEEAIEAEVPSPEKKEESQEPVKPKEEEETPFKEEMPYWW